MTTTTTPKVIEIFEHWQMPAAVSQYSGESLESAAAKFESRYGYVPAVVYKYGAALYFPVKP